MLALVEGLQPQVLSLKAVLEYYGIIATEKAIGLRAGTTREHGTSPEHLLVAARSYGLEGSWKRTCSVSDLQEWYERGVPVIVNWFSVEEGHYSVVVGVDKTSVTLMDPEIGATRTFTRADFKRVWFDFTGSFIRKNSDMHVRCILPLFIKNIRPIVGRKG